MVQRKVAPINFDLDDRFVCLARDSCLDLQDARRQAAEWHSLGVHLDAVARAYDYRRNGFWPHFGFFLVLGLIIGALSMSLGLSIGMLYAATHLGAYVMPAFVAMLIAVSACGLALAQLRQQWRELLDIDRELIPYVNDGRAAYFYRLWCEIQAWNQRAPQIQVLALTKPAEDEYADRMLTKIVLDAVRDHMRLMRRIDQARIMLSIGGELGYCSAPIDPDRALRPRALRRG